MQMFNLLQTIYNSVVKVTTQIYGINVIDLCFTRTICNFVLAIPIIKMYGKRPVDDTPKEFRMLLLFRGLVGTVAFGCMLYAAKYLPIFIV